MNSKPTIMTGNEANQLGFFGIFFYNVLMLMGKKKDSVHTDVASSMWLITAY